jgi:hypothetical protein
VVSECDETLYAEQVCFLAVHRLACDGTAFLSLTHFRHRRFASVLP